MQFIIKVQYWPKPLKLFENDSHQKPTTSNKTRKKLRRINILMFSCIYYNRMTANQRVVQYYILNGHNYVLGKTILQ